ncbi:MAG: hypothetical protein Q9195_006431 [Heterodermia aff. obscurata]
MECRVGSFLMDREKADEDYWKGIQDLEIKIILLTYEVQTHKFLKNMQFPLDSTRGCQRRWWTFEELPARWEQDLADDKWEWKGIIIEETDWKAERKLLERAVKRFKYAKPREHGREAERTEDYCADAFSKGATQISHTPWWKDASNRAPGSTSEPQSTTAISENRALTFGGAFRTLLIDLNLLIILMNQCICKNTPELADEDWDRIRNQEILIKKAVENLSKNSFLTTMEAGIDKDRAFFISIWKSLQKLSTGWEESSSKDNKPATHVYDQTLRKNCNKLIKIHMALYWANKLAWVPDERAEWSSDYIGDPPAGPNTSTKEPEPLQSTFGGSFRSLISDLTEIKRHTYSYTLDDLGRKGDCRYWKEVEALETRVKDTIPQLTTHPLFTYMSLGTFHTHDGFMSHWKELETMSQKWEDTVSIWKDIDTVIAKRDWKGDHTVVKGVLRLQSATPHGFEYNVNWTQDKLPASKIEVHYERPSHKWMT